VSDYQCAGVFAPAPDTQFDKATQTWTGGGKLLDRTAGKVKSDEPELWLRLVRAPKLVDKIRTDWQFHGILVKFKLEVGVSDADLLVIAEKSRQQSQADWMVANTLEGAEHCAFLGSAHGYQKVPRAELARVLLDAIEGSGAHG
jgi:phosphopantothenoylcysteine synthetase/decarboxylase